MQSTREGRPDTRLQTGALKQTPCKKKKSSKAQSGQEKKKSGGKGKASSKSPVKGKGKAVASTNCVCYEGEGSITQEDAARQAGDHSDGPGRVGLGSEHKPGVANPPARRSGTRRKFGGDCRISAG